MKKLTFSATLVALAVIPQASFANTATIGNITIEQVGGLVPGTFDNNVVGATTGYSNALTSAGVTDIYFFGDGKVSNGPSGVSNVPPAGDNTNYLWGFNFGVNVRFLTNSLEALSVNSFYIYWGSIDAASGDGYDNSLMLTNGDIVTGSQFAAAAFSPVVNGQGSHTDIYDNQWFKISDETPFDGFKAISPRHSFEFDMAIPEPTTRSAAPEPSTWVMMALGFAALGYSAFRRGAKALPATG
jgi:hypothetical protein